MLAELLFVVVQYVFQWGSEDAKQSSANRFVAVAVVLVLLVVVILIYRYNPETQLPNPEIV